MPNRDGTGPFGQGFLTGRGFGNCKGAQNLSGFCPRKGFGSGRSFRKISEKEEKEILKLQKEEIEKRISEIDPDKG